MLVNCWIKDSTYGTRLDTMWSICFEETVVTMTGNMELYLFHISTASKICSSVLCQVDLNQLTACLRVCAKVYFLWCPSFCPALSGVK